MAGFDPKAYAADEAPAAAPEPAFDPKAYAAADEAPKPEEPSALGAFAGHLAGGMTNDHDYMLRGPKDAERHAWNPAAALEDQKNTQAAARKAEAEAHPWAAGAGDVAGAMANPINLLLGGAAGAAGVAGGGVKSWVLNRLARGAAGAASGYGMGAADALSHGGSLSDANEAGKGAAVLGGAGGLSPGLTGAAVLASGLQNDDPAATLGGGLMAGGSAAGALGKGLGGAMENAGARARSVIQDTLAEEHLPVAVDAYKAQQASVKANARQGLAQAKAGDRAQAQQLKAQFNAAQGNVSQVPDRFAEARKAQQTALDAKNAETLAGLKSQDSAELQNRRAMAKFLSTTKPVGGEAPPGLPANVDLDQLAASHLGAETKDANVLLRSIDPMGIRGQLTPEALKGEAVLKPRYAENTNDGLGKFSEGLDARFQQIRARLEAEHSGPRTPQNPKGEYKPLGFKDARWTEPSVTMKPNPLAGFAPQAPGFVPEALPAPKTPADFGVAGQESGALKPNPLAGFAPKAPSYQPAYLPAPPEPTAASIRPGLAGQVDPKIDAMRADRGMLSRLGGGAARGLLSLKGAAAAGYGIHSGHLAAIPAGGAFGIAETLARDPVVAARFTGPVGRVLSGKGALAARVSKFLAGSTPAVMAKKIDFLMKNDPQFAAAVTDEGSGEPK